VEVDNQNLAHWISPRQEQADEAREERIRQTHDFLYQLKPQVDSGRILATRGQLAIEFKSQIYVVNLLSDRLRKYYLFFFSLSRTFGGNI
jgi:hypothetical protein